MANKRRPPVIHPGIPRLRRRELDQRVGLALRGDCGRRFFCEQIQGSRRAGRFFLPEDVQRRRRITQQSVRSVRGAGRLFDYFSAGGSRWMAGRDPAMDRASRNEKIIEWMALGLVVLWLAFRWIPPV